ncbi:MAG: PAS domain-containing sensor histidine kinase [Bacteroidota bacterium]
MELKENMYEVLFESIQEGLILVDSKGVIVDNNATAEGLFGYTSKELIGERIELLVPVKQREKHRGERSSYHENPQKRSMGSTLKLNGQRKDGSVFPVEVSLNPLKDDRGESFVVALVSDVTIRREAEEQLNQLTQSLENKVRDRTREIRESEQLYKSIARNFPGGVISIFDRNFKYLFAEGQGLYDLGIETNDLIGLDYLERIVPAAREYVEKELMCVFDGEYRNFEVQVGVRTYALSAVPLKNEEEEIDKILVVEKNITDQKRMEQKLELNLEKERELNEMKSRFVSMASHEFRTPLTTINSSAGLILKYNERSKPEKIDKHISRIKSAVRNLTSILNDFLSLEKLESGKINPVLKDSELVEVLNETCEDLSEVKKKGQQINYNGPDSLQVHSDPQLIKNIILNLLSNAIKYSPEGAEIDVSVTEVAEHVDLAVRDRGIGIPESDQSRMFDRFFRAGNVTNIEGTGLGLNIVGRYLNLIGGKISFESIEGKGTTFTVNFPKNIKN